MSVARRRSWAAAVAAVVFLCAPAHVHGQVTASDSPFFTARYDPRLRFRTISTPRFEIHFHQHEEELAQRLARIAEQVAADVEPRLGATRQRVHVVLVDQTDVSNGWATVIPYNLIEVAAVPPRAQSLIGNTNDWLRLVFTHEYTHVVHLEKSGGWLGSFRHVFGRLPLFYPNLFLPEWQIEGIATFEESALTPGGRLRGGDFRMILDRVAAAGRYASLDRAGGGVIDWPSGATPYLYGGFFHQCLADRYGRESHGKLADATARRLPLFGSRAFRDVYGRSLGDLWDDCRTETEGRARAEAGRRERLTRHGFVVTSPAFTADGRLFYSVANPHGFPALMELAPDGESREVTTRVRGERLAATRGVLVFDQLEIVAEIDVQSDIYAVDVDGGNTRRLTRRARAADPDVAPDGTTIVCTVQRADRRLLATFTMPPPGQLAQPQPLVSEPFTEFTSPRWSPDGRRIVVERRRLGGPSEIVIVEAQTGAMSPLVSTSEGRNVSPAWLPDGRSVLFASDRGNQPFTLYRADVDGGRVMRLAGVGDGAQSPALSPDGRRLVFVGYSADGYDLYAIPFDGAAWEEVQASGPRGVAPAMRESISTATSVGRTYRPWRTLAPRFWSPVIESDGGDVTLGAATAGWDALGRHALGGYAAWSFERSRAVWQADYTYARWRPALFVSASDDTETFRSGEVRARELNAGALFPVRRVRWSSAALVALHAANERYDCPSCDPAVEGDRRRGAARLAWNVSNAKSFGYSISAEQGGAVQVTTEWTRRALGADGDSGAITGEARGYLRAFPRHGVVAGRVGAATSWGDEPMRRVFSAAGAGPQNGGFDFGVGAVGLLRGFEESDLVGYRAFAASVDYRVPLAWIQRGIGTLPLLFRNVHGAVFADVGHAWDESFRAADISRSLGAELAFDVVVGYSQPVTLAAGAAWRDDGRDQRRRGAVAFVRLGRAF